MLVASTACGGASSSDLFVGTPAETNGALDDGSASSGDSAPGDAGSSTGDAAAASLDASEPLDAALPDAGVANDGGDPCPNLLADVKRLRADVTTCSLTSLEMQCDQQIDDLCCKLTVTANAPDLKKFDDAVKLFKKTNCMIDCNSANCSNQPSKVCQPTTGTKGSCVQ